MEQLSKVFEVNVLGPFYMVHAVVPHMPRGGRIVNISSTNSKRGNVNISTYAASKAALDNLTWTWAGEVSAHFHDRHSIRSRLSRNNSLLSIKLRLTLNSKLGRSKGITVNTIAPGPVLTDLYPPGQEDELMAPEIALTRAEIRAGTPADIGDAVLLLVNEKSRWITGQYISLSGGVTY